MSDQGAPTPGGENEASHLSRRDFLRRGAAAAAGAVAAGSLLDRASQLLAQQGAAEGTPAAKSSRAAKADKPATAGEPTAAGEPAAQDVKKSRVIVITHPEALLREYEANRPVIEKMIERAVRELTGAESEQKAWRQIAAAGDRVSMKITRAGGPNLRTHDEIPAYLSKRLAEVAGVEAARIRAWDRTDLKPEEMELSESYMLPSRGKETRLRAALTKDVTAIINLPVLKMHSGTGASIALKNHFGSINNPSAFHGWEAGEMWKSIAELNNLEPIRKRTRLVIVDATRPLYRDGPTDRPDFRWNFNGLIVGLDPVAVESVGLDILDKKREEANPGAPGWPATDGRKTTEWAQRIGLGHADKDRIELVTIRLD